MPQTQQQPAWWVGLSRPVFMAEAARRVPQMNASEQSRWLDACRLAELKPKKLGKKVASRTIRES